MTLFFSAKTPLRFMILFCLRTTGPFGPSCDFVGPIVCNFTHLLGQLDKQINDTCFYASVSDKTGKNWIFGG